jgi:glycyl-tRNA synthetase beta chain
MSKDLLLEIGTEEIPASFLPSALKQMKSFLQESFQKERIDFKDITTYATPRRLVLIVKGVAEESQGFEVEVIGPIKKVGFDENGKLTQAAIKFAESCGVEPSLLKLVNTKKGERLVAVKKVEGKPTKDLLKQILPELIRSITFPKSMRWEDKSFHFARPIRWIVALFGDKIVDFDFEGIRTSRITFGHRTIPDPIEIILPEYYLKELEKNFCVVDQREREQIIRNDLTRISQSLGGSYYEKEGLIDEVVNLVEYPVVLCGRFDEKYLNLPCEIIIESMCEHQRYFPVMDKEGKLLSYFLMVSNLPTRDSTEVVKGNEKVLKARLEDARFYFEEDRKKRLQDYVEEQKGVIWQEELGLLYEKTQRIEKLAQIIAAQVAPELIGDVKKAARLCKADLLTGVVSEFPTLQGIIGYHYALMDGESKEIALAIKEHYLPQSAKDSTPQTKIGAIVAIADKLDTLVGSFGIGLIPTGSEDPYGLRRQAQGIILIILEKGFDLNLKRLIGQSYELYREKIGQDINKLEAEVLEFLKSRMEWVFSNLGYPQRFIKAVSSIEIDQPYTAKQKIEAFLEFKDEAELDSLSITFKRVSNILKSAPIEIVVKEELFCEEAERELYTSYLRIKELTEEKLRRKDYLETLKVLDKLRLPVDKFFDKVMVMVEERDLRNNRLSLLYLINRLFRKLADFSKL